MKVVGMPGQHRVQRSICFQRIDTTTNTDFCRPVQPQEKPGEDLSNEAARQTGDGARREVRLVVVKGVGLPYPPSVRWIDPYSQLSSGSDGKHPNDAETQSAKRWLASDSTPVKESPNDHPTRKAGETVYREVDDRNHT